MAIKAICPILDETRGKIPGKDPMELSQGVWTGYGRFGLTIDSIVNKY